MKTTDVVQTVAGSSTPQWPGVIDAYRDRLPLGPDDPTVSLGEGGTPLVRAPHLSERVHAEVWLKVEGVNPTGSFKDRGMTVAVSKAAGEGAEATVCASTGNTAASAAAYAVRAGLTPLVLLPAGRIAQGKLAQALMHAAQVVQIDGNFDQCLALARLLADQYPVALVNSVNQARIEGQKTAAFEVCDALGRAPDLHVLPVGNAGNITAYWRGYCEYAADGTVESRPRMWGFQAAGAAPLVLGHPVDQPDTVATAIRIGRPASGEQALAARDESGGLIDAVSDEQILAAQRFLAAKEGVFVEPASATGVAGLLARNEQEPLAPGQVVVVTVTGHGLKDVATALEHRPEQDSRVVAADPAAVARACGLDRR